MKIVRRALKGKNENKKKQFITKIGKKVKVVNTKFLNNRQSNGKLKKNK